MLELIFKNFKINPSNRELDYNFMIGLILTIILTTILSYCYRRWSSQGTYSDNQFSRSIFLVTTCTYVIVYIVKESITLSLGLVGALSIVRFRTPIKDPFELAILFVSIAIGIANAAQQYIPSVVLTIIVTLYLVKIKFSEGKFSVFKKLMDHNKKNYVIEIHSLENVSLKDIIENLKQLKINKVTSVSKVNNDNIINLELSIESLSHLDLVREELDKRADISYHINEI
jgi:uncharacterized membrane protein YhiD involved in acid resistance